MPNKETTMTAAASNDLVQVDPSYLEATDLTLVQRAYWAASRLALAPATRTLGLTLAPKLAARCAELRRRK